MYFSEAGTAAVDLKKVPDNLLHTLELCHGRFISTQSPGATMLTDGVLKHLADALPHNLLSALLQLTHQLRGAHGEQGGVMLAAVVFRSHELCQISTILRELTSSLALDQATATRNYESDLLQSLTVSVVD